MNLVEELTEVLNRHGKIVIMKADGSFKIHDNRKEIISRKTIEELSDLVVANNFCEQDILNVCSMAAKLGNRGIRGKEAGEMLKLRLEEVKAPSTETILERFWHHHEMWQKVQAVSFDNNGPMFMFHTLGIKHGFFRQVDFIHKQSCEIPIEEADA